MADMLVDYLKNKIDTAIKFKSIKRSYTALLGDKKDSHVKNLLMDLKMRFGFYDVKNPTPSRSRDFYEGQRSVVLHILTMSKHHVDEDTEDIEEMMKIINNEY